MRLASSAEDTKNSSSGFSIAVLWVVSFQNNIESPDEPDPETWDSDFESNTDDEFHPDENAARTIALIDALSEMWKKNSSNVLQEPPTLPPNPVLATGTTPASSTTPVLHQYRL